MLVRRQVVLTYGIILLTTGHKNTPANTSKIDNMRVLNAFRNFIAAVLTITLSSPVLADSDSALPDIGDPSTASFSRTEEDKLRRAVLAQIRRQLRVMNDPELREYANSLGTRILSAGVGGEQEFTFLVLNDSRINAFAAPGGIVALHTGLFNLSETEAELASVVAHEIGHVVQRHLARRFDDSKYGTVVTGLGVLASILAGVYNPNLGSAALFSTLGASSQSQLAYSREHEKEADRVGIRLLSGANFDPQAMPSFLTRLHRHSRANSSAALEFLSSHPVTVNRISDTKARANQIRGENYIQDSLTYQLIRARIRAMTQDPSSLIRDYEKLEREGARQDATDTYAYAGALIRNNRTSEAHRVLDKLRVDPQISRHIHLAKVQAYIAEGDFKSARDILVRLDEIYPNQESTAYYLARCEIELGRAGKALRLVTPYTRQQGHNPQFDKLKAEAAQKLGQHALSHESLADYYLAHGYYDLAIEQIDIALNEKDVDSATRKRLDRRKEDIREFAEEYRG